MKIYLSADHAGFDYKEKVKAFLEEAGHEFEDCGNREADVADDYPDYVAPMARGVAADKDAAARGIAICGSGIGAAIVANKIHGIRAVTAWSEESALVSRTHNDAQVLCLGARFLSFEDVVKIITVFLETPFSGGERHMRRIEKITRIEKA